MKIKLRVAALGIMAACAVGFGLAPRLSTDEVIRAPVLAPVYAPVAEVMDEHVLRGGETLSDVFTRALGRAELSGLVLALREHVDPRRILPNTRILVRRWAEDHAPRAVEVGLNADSILLLRRNSVGWVGQVVLTPTTVDTVAVWGVIPAGGSLSSGISGHPDLGHLPHHERESLVWRLAHIYGWELDFIHDIRPGDSFRVVYERDARPDGTSRNARVLVAEVTNRGRTIPAVYFDPLDDGGDYFTPDGTSLRLAFLRYPVDFPRITSNFSRQRYHPVLKRNRAHLGTDFGTGHGAPVKSTADGSVSFAGWDGGYGNLVKINHGQGYETRYAHLSRFAPTVRRGARVRQGQVIGYTGSTGLATAPHLHYEIRHHGRATDPRTVRLPAAPPVPREHMAAFRQLAEERAVLLAAVAPLLGGGAWAAAQASGELQAD